MVQDPEVQVQDMGVPNFLILWDLGVQVLIRVHGTMDPHRMAGDQGVLIMDHLMAHHPEEEGIISIPI
jgi:hypothetical protein